MNWKIYNDIKELPRKIVGDYIYVFEVEDNIIKIGFSSNIKTRMFTLLTERKLLKRNKRIAISEPLRNGRDLEKRIHELLDEYFVSYNGSTETYRFQSVNSFDFMTNMFFQVLCPFVSTTYGYDLTLIKKL